MKTAYTYTILRYIHDITTGEALNVGVAMYSPDHRFAKALCRPTQGRVKHAFPDLDGMALRKAIQHIQREFCKVGERLRTELPLEEVANTALAIGKTILPHDDSSLQWGSAGAGLTEDPEKEIQSLFSQYVGRYDEIRCESRRTDDDIWRTYKQNLETRNVLSYLTTKKIAVPDDEVEFNYAWKNGIWHCLEPVSFDLVQAESIREKAHRWLGHITSVKDAPEKFKIYFLLGEPDQEKLKEAVEKAIGILEKLPVEKQIVREKDAQGFSEELARTVLQHVDG